MAMVTIPRNLAGLARFSLVIEPVLVAVRRGCDFRDEYLAPAAGTTDMGFHLNTDRL